MTETDHSDDGDITQGVLHYFSRAMLEHATAFRCMFSQLTLKVRHTQKLEFEEGSAVDVSPSVVFGTIQIPPIMLTLLWLTAQGAWKVMRAYSSGFFVWACCRRGRKVKPTPIWEPGYPFYWMKSVTGRQGSFGSSP